MSRGRCTTRLAILAISMTLGVGTVAGVVYKPCELIVPTVAFPPTIPLTDHVSVGS